MTTGRTGNTGDTPGARDDRANAALWTGFAATYDIVRPAPPTILLDMLTQLAQVSRPRLVVDLGSGTGLSTRVWAERADEVIGIEPNVDMRHVAETKEGTEAARGQTTSIRYIDGTARATGLPAGQADIVTVSQALHWMEPEPTFAEVARLLRPGGVFAAYDYDWPPIVLPATEAAYTRLARRIDERFGESLLEPGMYKWEKSGHLERMRASGRFQLVREALLGSVVHGDAEAFVGLSLSDRVNRVVVRKLATEEESGIAAFRREVREAFGDAIYPWYLGYRVRLGIR